MITFTFGLLSQLLLSKVRLRTIQNWSGNKEENSELGLHSLGDIFELECIGLDILGEKRRKVKTPSDASPYYGDAIAVTSMLARLRL